MPTLLKASDRFTSTVAEGTPTVTVAAADRDPLVAVTVSVPAPVAGAVYRPAGVTVPPAPPGSTAQANAGWVARALPNWSSARGRERSVPRSGTVTADGDTVTPVGVWATVTVTVLVAVRWLLGSFDGDGERVPAGPAERDRRAAEALDAVRAERRGRRPRPATAVAAQV